MRAEKCETCRYFIPDDDAPRCSVPIWVNADLYRTHYTERNQWCALYEKEAENETPEHADH